MKTRKRILSLLLSIVLLAVVIPTSTFIVNAISTSDYKTKYTEFIKDSRWNGDYSYWGRTPYIGYNTGWTGCAAYASDFAAYVYNLSVESGNIFYSADSISTGDIVFFNWPYSADHPSWSNGPHWIVVLERNGNTLYTAEGNFSGNGPRIGNNYQISNGKLQGSNWGWQTVTFNKGYHYPIDSSHTHNYSTYVFKEAAHPHYKCYQCSCGDIQRNYNETVFMDTCETCLNTVRPQKISFLNLKSEYTAKDSIIFNWTTSPNTTHYSLLIYEWDGTEYKRCFLEQYAEQGLQKQFSPGSYKAEIRPYNSNYWEIDKSDWLHGAYGEHSFTITENTHVVGAVEPTCTEEGYTGDLVTVDSGVLVESGIVIPALGHDYHVNHVQTNCENVTVKYTCARCGDSIVENVPEFVSEWSEATPETIDEGLVETKTQYRFSEKEVVTSTDNSKDGYTPTASNVSYGSWSNVGWTKSKPTESDTLRITDTKTVTDTADYYTYTYSRSVSNDGKLAHYNTSYYSNYQSITVSQSDKLSAKGTVDGYTHYGYYAGEYGTYLANYWYNETATYHPAVTHTEWYYQTRTKTTTYTYEKWSDYSDWQDEFVDESDTVRVESRSVYRFRYMPIGHQYGEWSVKTAPTCATDGTEIRICSICGKSEERIVPAHHTEEIIRSVETTCTAGGYDLVKCTVCGARYKINEIAALGHHHVFAETVKPTCTEQGYEIYKCERCDDFYTCNFIDAAGHDYHHTRTVASTCTKDGYYIYTCSKCGDATHTVIPALGHYFVDGECVDCGIGEADAPYDMNGDGVLNALDLVAMKKRLIGGTAEETPDINGDGAVNVLDAIALKKRLSSRS